VSGVWLACESDVHSGFVFWSCVGILAMVALVAIDLTIVRAIGSSRRRRHQELERQWLPLLIAGLEHPPDRLPLLQARDITWFCTLWIRLHDAIKGVHDPLHTIAARTGVADGVRRMFFRKNRGDRLLAIAMLGRLQDRTLWDELVQLASDRDVILSLGAAQSLVRIDATKAIRLLLPIIATRDDWTPATVAAMLELAGPTAISTELAEAIPRTPSSQAHRLIRFLRLAHADVAAPLLRSLIRKVEDVESITACLRAFTDADDLDAVRPYLRHPRWEVRLRAVDTLGRLATAEDEEQLTAMLADREWWVRYRTAHALCQLFANDLVRVGLLQAFHPDPFARDILEHVLAERAA